MLKTFNALMAIQTTTYVNMVLHSLRQLPLLRRWIRDSVFARVRLKRFIAVVVRLVVLAGQIGLSIAYVGLLLYLPLFRFGPELAQDDRLMHFVHVFVVISFLVAGVSNAVILEPKRSKFIAVRLMRMSPTLYMKATLGQKYVWYFLRMMLAVLLFGMALGGSPLQLALLVVAATMTRVVWEYVHLKVFEQTGAVIVRQTGPVWVVITAGYFAAYGPLFLPQLPTFGSVVLFWPVPVLLIAAGLLAAVYLSRYGDYRTVVEAATRRDDPLLDMGRLMEEVNQSSVKMSDTDYELDAAKEDKLRSRSGYGYLHGLFVARHRKLIRRPLNIRLAVIAGFGAAGVVAASLYGPEMSRLFAVLLEGKLPVFMLVMLYLSTGERVCRAMFYHCDLSLLRYRFYRNAALTHFRLRLVWLIGQNALVAAFLAAVLTALYMILEGGAWNGDLVRMWVTVLSLSVFFSVHHLFLYYMLQPFTTELNVRNPLFTFVNSGIGSLCGISLFIRVPSLIFMGVAAGLTIVYLLLALVMVRRHGSRTFRVK